MLTKRVVSIAGMVGVCVALAGCSAAPVDHRPVVRIVEAAQPSVAIPLGQFLPSTQELSATLGTGPNGFMGQLVEGDADMLLQTIGAAQATPLDCVSTAYRLQKVVYDASPVRSVASSSWAGGGFDGPPVSGFFGVVQMTSAAGAQEFFATLTDRWRRCNGQTVVLQQPGQGARGGEQDLRGLFRRAGGIGECAARVVQRHARSRRSRRLHRRRRDHRPPFGRRRAARCRGCRADPRQDLCAALTVP